MSSPTGPKPDPGVPFPDLCNSDDCKPALAAVVRARNAIKLACADAEAKKSTRDFYIGLAGGLAAAGLAALGAAGAATATVFGIPVATALFITAGVLFAAAAVVALVANNANNILGVYIAVLRSARQDFIACADAVTLACPVSCWGDLLMPDC